MIINVYYTNNILSRNRVRDSHIVYNGSYLIGPQKHLERESKIKS